MSRFLSKKKLFPVYAATLSAVLYLIILGCSNILGYGNLTILSGDLFSQYTAFIRLFLDVLRGNGNFWYSFSVYLGSPTAAVHAYYCLSPFNLLYLIPGISISAMTIVLICCKLSLAAAMFQLFAQKGLCVLHPFTILLSVAYALCTFSVTMQIHIMWLDALYILPLLALCLISAARDGHFLPLPILYAYLFITNFYMGYIVGVFSALLYIALLIYYAPDRTKASIGQLCKRLFLWIGSVVLAAGCCAIILLPAAFQLFSARSDSGSSFQLVTATVLDVFNNLFLGEMQGLGSPFPLIYCGLPALLLLPIYFSSAQITRKEKTLVVLILFFYLCGSLFLPVYQFLHAFEAPNWYGHRYAFCIVFLLLALCCRTLPAISDYSKKYALGYLAFLFVFYAVMIAFQSLRFGGSYSVNSHEWWVLNAAFMAVYTLIYFHSRTKEECRWFQPLLTLLVCAELVINGSYCLSHNNFGFLGEEYIERWINEEAGVIDTLKQADPTFYRTRFQEEDCFNAPSYYHFPGLNSFSTTDAPHLLKTLSDLGIGTSYMTLYDHGYTELMDRLLSVKYSVDKENQQIAAAKDTLPIAFMSSVDLIAWRPTSDVFMNQENALALMTGSEYHFFTPIPLSEADVEKKNMDILSFDTGYGFQHESDIASNGIITFRFPAHKGETILAYFTPVGTPALNATTPKADTIVSGFKKDFHLSDGTIISSVNDPETGIPEIKLQFYAGANYDYFVQNISFCSYSAEELSAACQDLKTQQCDLISWTDGDVRFRITATEDRSVLFTSIPYDKGWEAYVDGVPAHVGVSLNSAFIALILQPGEHEVQLTYVPPYQFQATCISSLSAMFFLLVLMYHYHKYKSSSAKSPKKEEADNK